MGKDIPVAKDKPRVSAQTGADVAIREQIKRAVAREEGLRRWIFVLIIFILTMATFALSFLYRQYASTLDGAALSFLTSLIFTLFYVIIVEAAMRDAQNEALTIETEQVVKTVRSEIDSSLQSSLGPLFGDTPIALVAEHGKQLLPVEYFPPTSESNPRFVERLRGNLADCRTYIFRGGSAQNCAKFLAKRGDSKLQCRILILDPRADRAILVHAEDRAWAHRTDQSGAGMAVAEAERLIRDEIRNAISDLYALRKPFSIEVRTCADNLFYRSEIFDNEAFVSFYTSDRETHMPPTYIYKSGSFYYNAFLNDFEQSWRHPMERFEITQASADADRDETLRKLGLLA